MEHEAEEEMELGIGEQEPEEEEQEPEETGPDITRLTLSEALYTTMSVRRRVWRRRETWKWSTGRRCHFKLSTQAGMDPTSEWSTSERP